MSSGNGFDELNNELNKMAKAAKDLEQNSSVPFDEIFTKKFMCEHTNFDSFDAFLTAGGFSVQTNEEFEAIPDSEMNSHVSSSTNFSDWEDMLSTAAAEYTASKLGF